MVVNGFLKLLLDVQVLRATIVVVMQILVETKVDAVGVEGHLIIVQAHLQIHVMATKPPVATKVDATGKTNIPETRF